LKIINTTKTLKRQIKHDEKEQNKAGQKKRWNVQNKILTLLFNI
jgi:hypothetical protein